MNNETLKRDLASRLMDGVKVKNQYGDICTLLSVSNRLNNEFEYKEVGGRTDYSSFKGIKPYLFQTSALTKPIQIANYNNGEPFVPIDELKNNYRLDLIIGVYSDGTKCMYNDKTQSSNWRYWEYCIIEKLNRWHINYRLSPEQFIEVTDDNNPYK